ncbi:helix-turn-helix domain-containing protein [Reichenbachiella ulvae]|uniref:AraC family transcriptional regulator n=1 Tax=Reichenbachiella ulvae TaxID=2980104 RepID=A0ABT3CY12_9BACT|nr:AraC family transcriptional regulator [Reichenbachiella ulvae]MCV9388093.1 AraC family transcriptional regulator [Reichenbachiella ulvae]
MRGYKEVKTDVPSINFWALEGDKVFHAVRGKTVLTEQFTLMRPHRLEHYVLRFMISGDGLAYIDHVPVPFKANWVMLGTPDQISWINFEGETEVEVITIAFNQRFIDLMGFPADITSTIQGVNSLLSSILDNTNGEHIRSYFDLILKEYKINEANLALLATLTKGLLLKMSLVCRPQKVLTKSKQNYANIYRSFMDDLAINFKMDHYVIDYVERLGISEKQLNRACKAMTKHSASYVIRERIDYEAKRLLFYSNNSVKHIAFYLGFKDPAHFNKFFRNINEMTPGQFRDGVH